MKWVLLTVALAGMFAFGAAGCGDGGGDTSGGGAADESQPHGH